MKELDVGDDPGNEDQVARTVSDDLVGDADLSALRVPSLTHLCHCGEV
jgi:hypothetical protein